MKERMCRKDDENLYSPKIHSKRVRELHELSVILKVPMTVIVDQAIEEYITRVKEKLEEFKQ